MMTVLFIIGVLVLAGLGLYVATKPVTGL